jgi:hypothetical protein
MRSLAQLQTRSVDFVSRLLVLAANLVANIVFDHKYVAISKVNETQEKRKHM